MSCKAGDGECAAGWDLRWAGRLGRAGLCRVPPWLSNEHARR